MPVLRNKHRVLLTAFLVIFLAALIAAEVDLVLDLILRPGTAAGTSWWVTAALMVMMASGGVVVLLSFKGRETVPGHARALEDLAYGLAEAASLTDAAAQLARFAHQVTGQASVAVYTLNPRTLQYEAQVTCDRQGRLAIPPDLSWRGGDHADGRLIEFPLIVQERQVGTMQLNYPPGGAPDEEPQRLIYLAAPLAALAIEGFLLRAVSAEQSAEIETQRRRIAQDLHDTLAQNIGYLRLKLDQITSQPPGSHLMEELERLHATAEEAYVQVRSALDELNPAPDEDLQDAITRQAQAISRRAGLQLRIHQIGVPYALTANVRHHILYMAREALFNIEKHAHARRVSIQLLWLEQELILKITDDGIGFDPRQPHGEGHYGLWIMNYRAREVGGDLKITPGEEGRGTEVTLWVPRRETQERAVPFFRGVGESQSPLNAPPVENSPARLESNAPGLVSKMPM